MSEVVGGVTRRRPTSAPVDYEEQMEPYMRKGNKKYDKEKWRDIKMENKIIQSKLRHIQQEPPAVFHAPLSYKSVKCPRADGPMQHGTLRSPGAHKAPPATMPGHPHHVDVPPWPPKKCESSMLARQRRQREVDKGNTLMFQKLAEVYGSLRPRSILNPGGVYQIDDRAPAGCVDLAVAWAERTAFYLPARTTHNNPLDPTYAHARYAAPDRPADRALAALGMLPGAHPSTTSPLPRPSSADYTCTRARRARHTQSARKPRAGDTDLSLELGGEAQAAALQARSLEGLGGEAGGGSRRGPRLHATHGVGAWAGHLGRLKACAVQLPGSPQAGLTPQPSNLSALGDGNSSSSSSLAPPAPVNSPLVSSWSGSVLPDPLPCVSPEPQDSSISDAPPPEGWPGRSKLYTNPSAASPPPPSPPRHPRHPSVDASLPEGACRGYYASKDASHSVPKTLGVAQCAGCAARSFYKSSGVRLSACARGCNQAFYCSETCARLDWPTHEPYCNWVTNGQWMQPGCRTSQQLWVANGSLAAARAQLKKKGAFAREQSTIESEMGLEEELEKAVRTARAKEIAAEKRQAHVEYLAYHGMDGPRPCMYMGGKPI